MQSAVTFVVFALVGTIHCGYPNEGGLSNIAQGSADQAHSAVASQYAAAQRASYVAKSALAHQAAQAAATAQAALAGKHVLLQNLQQQKQTAENAVHEELLQLRSAENLASKSASIAESAAKQVAALRTALESAQSLAREAETVAENAAREMISQNSMVSAAKVALKEIEIRLESTRADYLATKEATQKALDFAQKAQHNAAAAGSDLAAVEAEAKKQERSFGHGGYYGAEGGKQERSFGQGGYYNLS